jgi:transcription antitermination factor NusG
VAHSRGCDFQQLRDFGFVVFYPASDDYVFLEDTDQAEKLMRRQQELGLAFLKEGESWTFVTEAEIDVMRKAVGDGIVVGGKISVVSGPGANLSGVITDVQGDRLRVILDGMTRKFDIWVDRLELVVAVKS